MMKKNQGFTLVEVMVVVAIISVIATIAFPMYREFTERARREQVRGFLSEIANAQERYFTINKSYATSMADLRMNAFTSGTEESSAATVALTSDGAEWTATATLRIEDSKCTQLILDNFGAKTVGTGSDQTECWDR